jgi:predicted esterase
MSALDLHVHRWVPAERPGLPTLLMLHGTGGDENDLLPLGRALLPGAAMLSLRGNVLEDLHRRTDELADFVAAASEEYGVLPDSLYAVGYSNGANIAASMLLSQPAALAGGVLFRAMVPFEPTETPSLVGKRVLISAGKLDQMISPAGTERLATILRGAGADVDLEWQPTGHGLTAGDLGAAQRFFNVVP